MVYEIWLYHILSDRAHFKSSKSSRLLQTFKRLFFDALSSFMFFAGFVSNILWNLHAVAAAGWVSHKPRDSPCTPCGTTRSTGSRPGKRPRDSRSSVTQGDFSKGGIAVKNPQRPKIRISFMGWWNIEKILVWFNMKAWDENKIPEIFQWSNFYRVFRKPMAWRGFSRGKTQDLADLAQPVMVGWWEQKIFENSMALLRFLGQRGIAIATKTLQKINNN